MRVGIDYTSAVTQQAGVGRYTRSLVGELVRQLGEGDEIVLWYGSGGAEARPLPAESGRVTVRPIPLPARWLTFGWQRIGLPLPLERFTGPLDVAHEPDFIAPPSSAPIIATIHDLSYLITPQYAHPKLRDYLTRAVPRTIEKASRIVTPSETTRRDVIERYRVPESRVIAILNGVDAWFHPPSGEAVQQALNRFGLQQPYFVTVGTVEPRKNHLALLKAFAALSPGRPEASLVILGNPGWLSEPIVEAIDEASARMPVRYLRYVDDSWLPALYAGSTALVYPSWYEGFGLPALEAMASGTAVIVSDRGSLPEVVGQAALIVDPADPESIADAMRRVLEQPELRRDLIARGIAHASAFRWDMAASQLLSLYRDVSAEP